MISLPANWRLTLTLIGSAGRSLRPAVLLALVALGSMAATACIKQSNTYPVEIFKEMHYAQFNRPQEPPRLPPQPGIAAFQGAGNAESVVNIPAKQERTYDVARASELYRVNCSVCHGDTGRGDGPAAPHINSRNSYFAAKSNGQPYPPPANLQAALVRVGFTPDTAYSTIRNGVLVMPRFGALLSEEDIRDIVGYLFDNQAGIASKAQ